jgi:hypothetical protein
MKSQVSAGDRTGDKHGNGIANGNAKPHAPLPTKHNDHRQLPARTLAAQRRLGVTPGQMRGVPRISHILASADGGVAACISALRLSDDDNAHQFLDRYDAISDSDLRRLTVEEICVAAKVETKRILELVVSSLVEDSRNAGALIAAAYHPKVVRATAEGALNDGVWFDEHGKMRYSDALGNRKLFLTATGSMPRPESNREGGIFVQVNTQQVNEVDVPQVNKDTLTADGRVFNAAEDDLKIFHQQLDGTKQLEAPKTVIDASATTIGHQYKNEEVVECVPIPAGGR